MIMTDCELNVSRHQLEEMTQALESFNLDETSAQLGSIELAQAEFDAIRGVVTQLASEISDYEELRSGMVSVPPPETLEELPYTLVRLRIATGYSHNELGEKVGVSGVELYRHETEDFKRADRHFVVQVAAHLGLNLESVLPIASADRSYSKTDSEAEIDWSRFPVLQMRKRNWFQNVDKNSRLTPAEKEALAKSHVLSVLEYPAVAMHRKSVRSGSKLDDYALLAWEARVLEMASRVKLDGSYNPDRLNDEQLSQLVNLSQYFDGPLRARKFLQTHGIALVIEPHLDKTYLDGAAFLHQGLPVIGLTLRYDRVDNFWFVLLHEVAHIILHLRAGQLEQIFDDLDSDADQLEREADDFASEKLIPSEIWRTSIARFTQSESDVTRLAESLRISPAIVAGRIRRERTDYTLLNDLVGHSIVQAMFIK